MEFDSWWLLAGCVWDVAFQSNNDLVTACSDYKARIWSVDSARLADEDVRQAYQAALAPKQPGLLLANRC